MASLVGNYQHVKNENLDEYFKVIGVPYIPRKMILTTSPTLEIKKGEDDQWIIRLITLLRTSELVFKIGEEFEESMPGNVILKNTASLEEDGSLVIKSEGPNETNTTRKYELQDNQIVLTMIHDKSGTTAKRYFNKVP